MNPDLRMPRWVVVWLAITAVIQSYDALFVLTKPLSDVGGPIGFLWPGHHLYEQFDHRYAGVDAFGTTQSALNLLEVILIIWALAHFRRWSGMIAALIVSVATLWKTVIYFGIEIASGLENTRHALETGDLLGFMMIAVLPNLFWIVIPLMVIISLARRVARVGKRLEQAEAPSTVG